MLLEDRCKLAILFESLDILVKFLRKCSVRQLWGWIILQESLLLYLLVNWLPLLGVSTLVSQGILLAIKVVLGACWFTASDVAVGRG